MEYVEVISYITSNQIQSIFFPLKIVFLIISLILTLFIIFALFNTSWLKLFAIEDMVQFITFRPFGLKRITKDWQRITKRIETFSEPEYKLAVIEADDMLDNVLKKMGYNGKNLEERLDKINSIILPNIEEIKTNHKVRNDIVYDPDYKLTLDRVSKLLKSYEQALKNLEVF